MLRDVESLLLRVKQYLLPDRWTGVGGMRRRMHGMRGRDDFDVELGRNDGKFVPQRDVVPASHVESSDWPGTLRRRVDRNRDQHLWNDNLLPTRSFRPRQLPRLQ